ncbi:hypothetical protein BJ742DRAFT_776390 [Cladochytrium replicatum]|nr:hypothetical protein BJ742DRAFT_776390 [Cladochytrium replicatum]
MILLMPSRKHAMVRFMDFCTGKYAYYPLVLIRNPERFGERRLDSTRRESWAKYLYRLPFDFLEEWTRMADEIVDNSKFTATTFKEVFPLVSIARVADAFADGIERMLTWPESQKKTMVDRGRAAAERKFSSKAFGDVLEVIVNRLANGETNGEGSYTFKLTLGLMFQVVCIAIYFKFTYY